MERRSLIKKLCIFLLIMSVISLAFMLVTTLLNTSDSMYIDVSTMELVQLEEPQEGDPIAIINTSLGEIRAVLYPEYSPNAVKNFTELAESGYYDNTYVFHSEAGAYSAAGSKLKDGTMPDGYDTERELVERELNQNLWPFKGAICALNTTVDGGLKEALFGGQTYYNGSRFALINTIEFDDDTKQELLDSSESQELAEAFIENGGIPNFSQQMTVIGQAYEGLDVIEELASLESDSPDDATYKIPKEDVMIISVTIGEYSEED
jgi:peptidyl-prolyl cis-trans isomerase B (cyclophilin B)